MKSKLIFTKMYKTKIFLVVLIVLFISACNSTKQNITDYDCNFVEKRFGEWVKFGEGEATNNKQTIMSSSGKQIEHIFDTSLTFELVKDVLSAKLGYTLSYSTITLTGTSTVINNGQIVEFYYRPVYKVYDIIEIFYTDETKSKEVNRRINKFEEVCAPQYAWIITDSQGTVIQDTRNNPITQSDENDDSDNDISPVSTTAQGAAPTPAPTNPPTPSSETTPSATPATVNTPSSKPVSDYTSISKFQNGLAIVEKNHKFGVIKEDGNVIIPLNYDKIVQIVENNHFFAKANQKCGIINYQGDTIISFSYENLSGAFSHGLMRAWRGSKMGFIDKKENVVIPFMYEDGGDFTDSDLWGVNEVSALVFRDGKRLIINTKGGIIKSLDN